MSKDNLKKAGEIYNHPSGKVGVLKEIFDLLQKIDALEAKVKELEAGICEHAKEGTLHSRCKLCQLAVAEKGYEIWVKKAKELEAENAKLKNCCKRSPNLVSIPTIKLREVEE